MSKKNKITYESPYWCGPIIEPRDWRSLPLSELTRAERNMAFCEKHLIVPEGDLVGKPIKFEDFQERFFYSLYDNPVATRRAYLSMARKNGKTAFIACINMVHIVGPEARQNSRIQSGALSREQAAEVFNYSSKMVDLSPSLRGLVRIINTTKTIVGLPMNVTYRASAAEAKTNMGGSPIVAILDETGQIKGAQDDFIDSVETSQGAYKNPLLIVISTQAADDADLLSIWLDDAKASKDPSIVAHVYAAPKGCDLSDERSWYASNPALGIFRSLPDLKGLVEGAIRMPSKANSVRNLNLNQRVGTVANFVSADVWQNCSGEINIDDGLKVYGGLDLSARKDLTAFVLATKVGNQWGWQPYFWTPEDTLADREKMDRAPYRLWVEQGFLRTTPGSTVDYEFVANEIAEIVSEIENFEGISFDRWRIDVLKKEFDRIDFDVPLLPFGQGFKDMSPAIDEVESLLLNSNLLHGDNPVMTMCAANTMIISDPSGNRKYDKNKATGRMDGIVAGTMAIGAAIKLADETEEEAGIFFF